jgi:hypothetical protein
MARKLVRIESANFLGFGCSDCNWVFNPSGAVVGETIEEMERKYQAERDKEFAAHVCTKTPQRQKPQE